MVVSGFVKLGATKENGTLVAVPLDRDGAEIIL
jgi:hypothetical protein